MSNRFAMEQWLLQEFDTPAMGGQMDPAGGQTPVADMNIQGKPAQDPNVTNQTNQMSPQPQKDNLDDDPQSPDMPQQNEPMDFETWRKKYMQESVKGDAEALIDLLNQVRDEKDLSAAQDTFISDNYNIQLLRSGPDGNIAKASKEIRGLVKERLDRNNPATSMVTYITEVLSSYPILNNIFIKMNGYGALKSDLHRKFIAALTGSVQLGIGGDNADLIYNTKEIGIYMSTRFNYRWGDFFLGNWALKEDDAERYLSEPELKRLKEGSPEEREVLRRRLVIESIASQFEQRAFIFQVTDEHGSIHSLGWDLATSLRSGYHDGRIVVRSKHNENSDAQITDTGEIVPLIDLKIYFVVETGDQDEDGMPAKEEIPFMENRSGALFLNGEQRTVKKAAAALPGMIYKETPYQGNPSDLKSLRRCIFSAFDMLMKQC